MAKPFLRYGKVNNNLAMFCFMSMAAPAKYSEQLLNNKCLDFTFKINDDAVIQTTEHGYKRKCAIFKGFKIIVWEHPTKSHKIEIKGSFHKLFEGGTNFKDFNFIDFKSAVDTLCSFIEIPPNELRVHSFEIGVNIKPPIEITSLIEGIKALSGEKFDRDTFHGKGLLIAFDFAQYRVKIYNKGLQYERPEQILRFELRVEKMAFGQKKGLTFIQSKGDNITTLQDFITGDMNTLFGNWLLAQWNKIIICPEGFVNPKITNPRTHKNFINGLNPDYWTGLDRKAYNRQFHKFRDIIKQFATIDLNSTIYNLIKEKWEYLSEEQKGQCYLLPKGNIVPFDNYLPEQRFCKSCGRDISHQNPRSKFCSELNFGPEAKRCRNKVSNRIRKEKRLYPDLTLFPVYLHFGF